MKTAIKCGKLFDSQTGTTAENMLVLTDGKNITDVLPCPQVMPEGYEIIDLSDSFVMPGMIDAHVHIASTGENDTYSATNGLVGDFAIRSLINAKKDLMAGFTTVRDCGGQGFCNISARDSIAKGDFPGARIFTCGGGLSSTGGHGDTHFSPYLTSSLGFGAVDSPDAARKAVRYNIKYGAEFIKVMATGGVMSLGTTVGAQQFTLDELKAITEVAKMYGVHTAAHAHGTSGIKDAARAGITSIEHGMMMDDEAVDLFCQHGTYHVPTIIAAERIVTCGNEMGLKPWMISKAQQVLDRHEWGVREGLKRGVKFSFGTDAGTPSNFHGKQGYEFELMLKFGFNVTQTLVAATKTNSELLQLNDKLGSVEKGKLADIVAFKKSPYDDITIMKDCAFVMKEGVVYKQ